MKIVGRIFTFFSIFLLYIIARELLELYVLTAAIHPLLGYATLIALAIAVVYFIVIPIYKIIAIPKNYEPVRDPEKVPALREQRQRNFRKNPYLIECGYEFDDGAGEEEAYQKIISTLQVRSNALRKRYVLQLFYSSSISQNGFLDAILILSSSVNLVKELFILYHGRVTNKDLWAIAKKVYFSMAIGGSEGVEYATQELFSKFATDSFKSVPFADKVLGSLADGFVNAALLTRISLITENYCKVLYIEKDRALYPSAEFIIKTTKMITADIFEKMTIELLRMSKEKTVDYVMMAVNPVGHLFQRSMGAVVDGTTKLTAYPVEIMKDVATIANKPFVYGLSRLSSIFNRSDRGGL